MTIMTSYHHQSNGQVEACTQFVKHMLKMFFDNNSDANPALLQIRSMPIGAGFSSPATLLFKIPI